MKIIAMQLSSTFCHSSSASPYVLFNTLFSNAFNRCSSPHNILDITRIFNTLTDGWQVGKLCDPHISQFTESWIRIKRYLHALRLVRKVVMHLDQQVGNTINYHRTFTEFSRLKSCGKHADCRASRIPFHYIFSVKYQTKLPNIK
jgi:hypothetical protein